MERHFVLPITIAAALHAGLLFGFRPSHTDTTKDIVRRLVTTTTKPPIEVTLDEPKSESVPDEKLVPKGSSPVERPTLPEPTPVEHPVGPTVNIPRAVPQAFTSGPKFDLSPAGRPDGWEGVDRLGDGLIGAKFLDDPPRARLQGSPSYPIEAKTRGLAGAVTVEFTVDENGLVHDPVVVNSSDRIFEDATLRAVSKWRFEPGKRAGRVVRFRMAVPVIFNLNDN